MKQRWRRLLTLLRPEVRNPEVKSAKGKNAYLGQVMTPGRSTSTSGLLSTLNTDIAVTDFIGRHPAHLTQRSLSSGHQDRPSVYGSVTRAITDSSPIISSYEIPFTDLSTSSRSVPLA
jgi:hypothetical protein